MNGQFGWTLITLGVLIVLMGLLMVSTSSLAWFGRLPGDLRIEGEGYRVYFPLATCIVISIVLSVAMWMWQWWTRG